jgi:hypothetical protein
MGRVSTQLDKLVAGSLLATYSAIGDLVDLEQ